MTKFQFLLLALTVIFIVVLSIWLVVLQFQHPDMTHTRLFLNYWKIYVGLFLGVIITQVLLHIDFRK